jgi:Fur family transcriptional regulator, ferric uptake regulator
VKNAEPQATDLLHQAGLRRTPVRVGVIEVLAAGGRPMSVPQILGKMKGVDSVTVYRTLNTFARKGLVHRVRGEDRTWLYAVGETGQRQTHRHPHFVCESCGRVECLESAEIPDRFVKSLGINSGYTVRYPEVLLHGLCPRCNVEE